MRSLVFATVATLMLTATVHADPISALREQQRETFAAHERVHAAELAKERAAAPEKLRERNAARATFAAKEKVHAAELSAKRQAHHPS